MNKLLAPLFLLAAGTLSAQISIGITIGAPPPPRVVVVRPVMPAPDCMWIDGYWYPVGSRYRWHAGYWTRPPYPGARWVMPHHDGRQYFAGYWDGDRGRFDHDHHWDRDHDRRDWGHDHERGHGRDHDHER